MSAFENYKFLQKFIGMDPEDGWRIIILRVTYSVVFVSNVLMTIIFLTLNFDRDMNRAMTTFPEMFGTMSVLATYWHLLVNRKRFHSICNELEDIVNERKLIEGKNKISYARAEHRTISVLKIIIKGVFFIMILYLSPFMLVAYHWCLGKYSIDSWIIYYPVWMPFGMNTTSGNATTVLYEAIVAMCAMCVAFEMVFLLIGSMTYMDACLLDIKTIFYQVNDLSKSKKSELRMLECCKVAVDLHARVTCYMNQLADLTNMFILVTVAPFTMCICTSLLMIVKYSGTDFISDLQLPLIASVLPIIILFMLFSLGQSCHSNLMKFGETLYQTEWHRYPSNVRRFVLLMMMRSQQPFYLSAYGLLKLNLINFVQLLKWLYSAFMLLLNME